MVDTADIKIKAGNGGNGIVSFRREKFIPKGGPWGGDGGKGGDIIFTADLHHNTLNAFRRKRVYEAQAGEHGMKNRQRGHNGENLLVHIPLGTIIKDEKDNILYDMTSSSQSVIIDKGGRGGLGNWHFKSSRHKTPRESTQGEKIEEKKLKLELKLIADIGIVGLPSSGKSSLLNALTNANVKIAAYHFTTLEPNLGVLQTINFVKSIDKEIVLADIPGLIEGASDGKGLGHDFLKHIERTKVVIHVIDGSDISVGGVEKLTQNYLIIQNELKKWNEHLANKVQLVVINKSDISEVLENKESIMKAFAKLGIKINFISALDGYGLNEIVVNIVKMLDENALIEAESSDGVKSGTENKSETVLATGDTKLYTINNLPNKRIVFLKSPYQRHHFNG